MDGVKCGDQRATSRRGGTVTTHVVRRQLIRSAAQPGLSVSVAISNRPWAAI